MYSTNGKWTNGIIIQHSMSTKCGGNSLESGHRSDKTVDVTRAVKGDHFNWVPDLKLAILNLCVYNVLYRA